MTAAEMSLFESGTGDGQRMLTSHIDFLLILIQVPVIAIFTKMDALDRNAFNKLKCGDKKLSSMEARSKAPSLARDIFEQSYLRPLKDVKNEPACIVQLRGMLFHINSTDDQLNHSPPRHAQGSWLLRRTDHKNITGTQR